MNYEQQHAAYIRMCEDALTAAASMCFQNESKVSEAARYTLMNGGKRVRGVMVLAVSEMLGGAQVVAQAFAAALEMVHAFSLVHDDLPCMDDDDMRRGKPSAHIVYGEATALLAGDLLALEAFHVLAQAPGTAQQCLDAVQVLAEAAGAKGMIWGQELDLHYENTPADDAVLRQIQRNKTGALFRAAVSLGMITADTVPDTDAIVQYADAIGLVFQIVDDILDVTSTEDLLGKPIGSDAQQGKSTFVTMHGLEQARSEVETLTTRAVIGLEQVYGEKALFLAEYAQQLAARVF